MARCHYCKAPNKSLTRDHIVPRSRAGVDEDFNIVFACYRCNQNKRGDWPTCDCPKCTTAVDNHWAMIECIRQWSPAWADQLTWVANNGTRVRPMAQTVSAAVGQGHPLNVKSPPADYLAVIHSQPPPYPKHQRPCSWCD